MNGYNPNEFNPDDKDLANRFLFNANKNKFNPPMDSSDYGPQPPTERDWLNRAKAGVPGAMSKLIPSGALNPDGSLKEPPRGHGHDISQGASPPEPKGSMEDAWKKFKEGLFLSHKNSPKASEKKAASGGGANVNMTGTTTNPTAHMDDDDSLNKLKELINSYEKKDRRMDLSPIVALVDTWTGSNLLKAYDAPLGDDEREKIVLGLKGKLFQHEADLKYKKAYLTQQAESEKLRQKFKEEDANKDRASREKIAGIGAAAKTNAFGVNSVKAEIGLKNKYFTQNKKALNTLAKIAYPPKNEFDTSYQANIPKMNDDIYKVGKQIEEEGGAEPGMGYGMAMELFKAKISGMNK